IVSWSAIPGAVTYKTQLSKNGGETWPNHKTGLTSTSVEASGLYVGKSYGFRVYGIDANGATLEQFYEKTFAPIALTSAVTEYEVGSPIAVALSGAENASATIQWYHVTESGDVEITDAGNSLSYTPTTADYDIKVVATGTGDSEGSVSEVTILMPAPVSIDYDPATRQAIVSWTPIRNITTYKLQLSKNGGETWANYINWLGATSTTVSGLYPGKTYGFRVYGIVNGTSLPDYYEVFFTPSDAATPASLTPSP
ncbi:MAG: fibronectin type III domain-containing protein, partial [Thermoguttaceae bacterium]|nr:fibronectin type III domain-containing protein [Thermoguttaceae bacterium]